jgi:putative hydrolase of the HAD superfamily
MIKNIIFDLSEVLIAGLVGIEKKLAVNFSLDDEELLKVFAGENLERLLKGEINEDEYLETIILKENWNIDKDYLKKLVRENFLTKVESMDEILASLSENFKLYLLSDHASEWVEFIHASHPFLDLFHKKYFSYEIGSTKKEERTFRHLLEENNLNPTECIFIDDSAANVKVAEKVGLKAFQFVDAEKLKDNLKREGLLKHSL